MSIFQYILGISAALLTIAVVVEMLRRRRLRERHAIWWLALGFFALVISIFPQVVEPIASAIGFESPANLIFFVSLVSLFLVALQHSAELTRVENENQKIVERLVLLELKIEEIDSSPETMK